MRFGNVAGRAVLVSEDLVVDIADASAGEFGPAPEAALSSWPELVAWGASVDVGTHPLRRSVAASEFLSPLTRPAQIFGIGLNYADHAAESQLDAPEHPLVFTKFSSSLTGAESTVELPGDTVDWEVELVVVVGVGGRDIPIANAWDHVAGLAVGQDLSERTVQFWGNPAQFSLGKSFAGFSPVGPVIVTADELIAEGLDPDDLAISCELVLEDGTREVLQNGRTKNLLFDISSLIAQLSNVVDLLPGDMIFSGTPAGVGGGRTPKRFLKPGEHLISSVEGIGSISQHFVAPPAE